MYCFVSEGDVHFVPVDSYQDAPVATKGDLLLKPPGSLLKIKNKNLLYSLNDPSLSDLDSTNDTSVNEYDEDDDDKEEGEDVDDDEHSSTSSDLNFGKKSLYLPQFTIDLPTNLSNNFQQVKELLTKVFPWIQEPNEISVKQLTGGITNMLLSCKYTPTNLTVLMRVYGQGTNLIIDRHREFVLHLVLNSLNLAPPIHARFHNGLVYGFLPGRSLQSEELQDPKLFPCIAQQLGIWHNKVSLEDIEVGVEKLRRFTKNLKKIEASSTQAVNGGGRARSRSPSRRRLLLLNLNGTSKPAKKSISNVWELIEDWMNIVPIIPELIESFQENNTSHDANSFNEENIREIIQNEFEWLRSELTENSKSPVVSCHCDLLSGNIIIPVDFFSKNKPEELEELPLIDSNPIQFIDYEYMLPAPRAFDIANHFFEWQGFDCNRAAIPTPSKTNPVMIKWVKGYLNNINATTAQINEVIDEISMFYGMPGFYWGIWAMIQSEISTIDFNYANYGKLRFQEYWDWKKHYLKDNK